MFYELEKNRSTTQFKWHWYFGWMIPKRCVCLFIIQNSIIQTFRKGIFSRGIVEHLAITCKIYELDLSIPSTQMVLIRKMGLFTFSNTLAGNGDLFMNISLKLLAIVVFTEHDLTISFITIILFILPEIEGFEIKCKKSKSNIFLVLF